MKAITITESDSAYRTYIRHSHCADDFDKIVEKGDDFEMAFNESRVAFDYDAIFDISVAIGSYLSMTLSNQNTNWIWQAQNKRSLPSTEELKSYLGRRESINPIYYYDSEINANDADELFLDILNNDNAMTSILKLSTMYKTKLFNFIIKLLTDTTSSVTILCNSKSAEISNVKKDQVISCVTAALNETDLSDDEISSILNRFNVIITSNLKLISDIYGMDEIYMSDVEEFKKSLNSNIDNIMNLHNMSIFFPSWGYNVMVADNKFVNVDTNMLFVMVSAGTQIGTFTA